MHSFLQQDEHGVQALRDLVEAGEDFGALSRRQRSILVRWYEGEAPARPAADGSDDAEMAKAWQCIVDEGWEFEADLAFWEAECGEGGTWEPLAEGCGVAHGARGRRRRATPTSLDLICV